MSVPVRIGAVILASCIFYAWVGRQVPQKEEHPPPSLEGPDAPLDELVNVGAQTYPGQCGQCHGAPGEGGTERAPDLDGLATRAPGRAEERAKELGRPFTAEEYLAEALCDPGAYLVKRSSGDAYGNIMSFKLAPEQILAVLAFLQTLGGEPTDEIRKAWETHCAQAAAEPVAGAAKKDVGPPDKIVVTYACGACHDLEGSAVKAAPPLGNIGARMSAADIFLQISYPDSQIAEAPPGAPEYIKGQMKQTLDGNGFYRDVGPEDLHQLALWLAAKK